MKRTFFLLIFIIFINCSNDDNLIDVTLDQELPFDTFWLTTTFSSQDTSYFHTWVETREYGDIIDFYHYYASDEEQGFVPLPCEFSYEENKNVITVFISCTIQLHGTIEPNDFEWPEVISYELEIILDNINQDVTSATLFFPDYNHNIDFTSQIEANIVFTNGYEELVIGGSDYLVPTNNNKPFWITCVLNRKID